MKILVVITTFRVPFDTTVQDVRTFSDTAEATAFINAKSQEWWQQNQGDRCVSEFPDTAPYSPIKELGYDTAHYELWDGEAGFEAVLDAASYAELHEAHYAREFDAKGIARPGYLVNAYVDGAKPGGMTDDEKAKYESQQVHGMAAIEAMNQPKH